MVPQKTLSARSWLLMVALALIWGGSFLSNRLALVEVGVFTTVAFRVTGAMAVMWFYVAIRGYAVPRAPATWAAFALLGLFSTAVPFSLIVWGQQHIASGLASILNASTAIFGVLVAGIAFRDERLTGRKIIGVGLGFAGVATAIGAGALARLDPTSAGQIAIIAAALSYAVSGAFARIVVRDLRPEVATAGMLTGAALVMLPAALLLEGVPDFSYSLQSWGALVYLAVIASALAYILFYRIIGVAGAGNLSLVTLLVSPVAICLGAVVLDETLPPHVYAGFGLIAAGMLVTDGRILRLLPYPRHPA